MIPNAFEATRNDKICTDEIVLVHAIQDYVVHLEASGRTKGTIACYLQNLDQLAKIIGCREMNTIKDIDLNKAVCFLGRSDGTRNNLLPVTMNRIKSVYRSFFKWSFETGRMQRNPARLLSMGNAGSTPTIPITAKEVFILLETIRKSNDYCALRDEALFAMYAFTGIRRAEGLALRIRDYDPVSSMILLKHSKGGIARRQPAPSFLSSILAEYLTDLRRKGNEHVYGPLFPGRMPEVSMSMRQAQNRFNRWKTQAGIREGLTIHSFRSGFANRLYQTTRDIHLVARAMGHIDIRSTKLYIENNVSDIQEAVEKTFRPG
jgi:integrase/recombinase XerD